MATWADSNRPAWTEPKILFGSRALEPNVRMDFRENAPFCFAPLTRPRPVSVEVSEFRFAKRPYKPGPAVRFDFKSSCFFYMFLWSLGEHAQKNVRRGDTNFEKKKFPRRWSTLSLKLNSGSGALYDKTMPLNTFLISTAQCRRHGNTKVGLERSSARVAMIDHSIEHSKQEAALETVDFLARAKVLPFWPCCHLARRGFCVLGPLAGKSAFCGGLDAV